MLNQKGIVHIIIIIAIILAVVLILFILFFIGNQSFLKLLSTKTDDTGYKNPFKVEKSEYENPFSDYTNPFEGLQ